MTTMLVDKTITDHYMESLRILYDMDNDSITLVQKQGKPPEEIVKVIVLNPREALEVADFIYNSLFKRLVSPLAETGLSARRIKGSIGLA